MPCWYKLYPSTLQASKQFRSILTYTQTHAVTKPCSASQPSILCFLHPQPIWYPLQCSQSYSDIGLGMQPNVRSFHSCEILDWELTSPSALVFTLSLRLIPIILGRSHAYSPQFPLQLYLHFTCSSQNSADSNRNRIHFPSTLLN